MLGIGHTQFTHPDLSQSRIRKDERDVVSLIDMLKTTGLIHSPILNTSAFPRACWHRVTSLEISHMAKNLVNQPTKCLGKKDWDISTHWKVSWPFEEAEPEDIQSFEDQENITLERNRWLWKQKWFWLDRQENLTWEKSYLTPLDVQFHGHWRLLMKS